MVNFIKTQCALDYSVINETATSLFVEILQ